MVTMQHLPTDLPAAALEFCPISGYQDLLVCGTYKLDEGPSPTIKNDAEQTKQTRFGKCLVLQEEGAVFYRTQEVKFPGILDLKW
jgi:diphthamide biosynthesis protein 7